MQRIRAIVSSGTQYIDTGFKPTGNTKVVVDFCAYDQTTAQQAIFGSRPGDTNRFTIFTGYSTSSLQADYNTYKTLADETVNLSGIDTTQRTVLEMSNTLVVNGVTISTVDKLDFASTYSMFLFANNVAGTPQTYGKLRLYSCKIYDNGAPVRDFVPCVDDNNVVCLYDQVTQTYAYNAGTGSFTAGYPAVFFRRRPYVKNSVLVTITGSGDSTYAYVIINGTTYTSAAEGIEVRAGDTIQYYVSKTSGLWDSSVKIDGTEMWTNQNWSSPHSWTVPKGISQIAIKLNVSAITATGSITITTS